MRRLCFCKCFSQKVAGLATKVARLAKKVARPATFHPTLMKFQTFKQQTMKNNTKRNHCPAALCLMLLAWVFAACSENTDDPAYRSQLPTYADVEFEVLDADRDIIYTGDRVVARVVESRRGRLLGAVKNTWTCTPVDVQHEAPTGYIYDATRIVPTDTFIAPSAAGRYEMRLEQTFNINGQWDNYNSTVQLPDNGSVEYKTLSQLLYGIVVKKQFAVRTRPDNLNE